MTNLMYITGKCTKNSTIKFVKATKVNKINIVNEEPNHNPNSEYKTNKTFINIDCWGDDQQFYEGDEVEAWGSYTTNKGTDGVYYPSMKAVKVKNHSRKYTKSAEVAPVIDENY